MLDGLGTGGDDAAVIQAEIDANPGAAIHLGSGDIVFKSPLHIAHAGSGLIADKMGALRTTIAYSSDADIITMADVAYPSVENMQFNLAGGFTQNGALIRVTNCHNARVLNNATWGAFFYHVVIDGGPAQYITYVKGNEFNPFNSDPSSAAVAIGLNGQPQDTFLLENEFGGSGGQGNCGILVRNSGGLNMRDNDIIDMAKQGFIVLPRAGESVRNTFIHNLQVDTCGLRDPLSGALVASDGGEIYDFNSESSWYSSINGIGAIFKDINNGSLINNKCYWDAGNGFVIDPNCINVLQSNNQTVRRP